VAASREPRRHCNARIAERSRLTDTHDGIVPEHRRGVIRMRHNEHGEHAMNNDDIGRTRTPEPRFLPVLHVPHRAWSLQQ